MAHHLGYPGGHDDVDARLHSDDDDLPDDGEESDPLGADPDDDPDDDDDDVFGPSIDQLLVEHRRRRRTPRNRRSASGPRPRARATDLPVHLKPLMGAANVAFMSNDYEKAENFLNRIIDEAPRCPEPLRTLALIYDSRSMPDRALEYYMKAVEVDRSDRELWKQNASRWKDKGDIQKAIFCLNQALRGASHSDPDALRARAQLYFEEKSYGKAAQSFLRLSKLNPFDVQVAESISQCFIKGKNMRRAIDALDKIVVECERQAALPDGHSIQNELVIIHLLQLLTELKLCQKRYVDANLLLVRLRGHCATASRNMTFVQRLMVAICQHRLGSDVLAAPVFHEFMSSSVLMDKHRLFLWQVADACYDSGHYHEASNAYTALIDMTDEKPFVDKYLRRALCYKEIDFCDGAKADLEMVLSIHPKHVVALLHMQEFIPKTREVKKRTKKAMAGAAMGAATGRPSPVVVKVTIRERDEAADVLEKANKMFEKGDYEGYLLHIYAALHTALELRAPWGAKYSSGEKLLANGGDSEAESGGEGGSGTVLPGNHERSRRWMGARRPPLDKVKLFRVGSSLMRMMDQRAFVQVAERVVLSFGALGELELAHPITRIFESVSHLRIYGDDGLRRKLHLLDLVTSVADGSVWRGYNQVRNLLLASPTDVDLLYALTVVEQLLDAEVDSSDLRNKSYRGLARLRRKHCSCACLAFVMANISSRGALNVQRYTVGFYLSALSAVRDNALVCLCVGVQVLYVAMGRRIQNRNEVMPHALAFLQRYRRMRMAGVSNEEERNLLEMETVYNLGRAMHQMGLVDVACGLYEDVLRHTEAEDKEWGDLRRDAGYNLMQIYRNSGAEELGSKICGEVLVF